MSVNVIEQSGSKHSDFNHSKVYIIDQKLFYVGSDNAYLGFLQEFGGIVEDEKKTIQFIKLYWDRLPKKKWD